MAIIYWLGDDYAHAMLWHAWAMRRNSETHNRRSRHLQRLDLELMVSRQNMRKSCMYTNYFENWMMNDNKIWIAFSNILWRNCRSYDAMNTYLKEKKVAENVVHDALDSIQQFKPDMTSQLYSVSLFQFQKKRKKKIERMNNANRNFNKIQQCLFLCV